MAAKVLIGLATLFSFTSGFFFLVLFGPDIVFASRHQTEYNSFFETVYLFANDYPLLTGALVASFLTYFLLLIFYIINVSRAQNVMPSFKPIWIMGFIIIGPLAFSAYFFQKLVVAR